jgi:hypothetical protein
VFRALKVFRVRLVLRAFRDLKVLALKASKVRLVLRVSRVLKEQQFQIRLAIKVNT